MTLLRSLRIPLAQLALLGLVALPATLPSLAFANHAVYVEGETDFDGDGRIGTAEDMDGADGIFGKINTAIGNVPMGGMAVPGNLGNNGKVIIVTSGRFLEVVNISNPVTLEGAPGVEADIEAFLAPAADPNRIADFGTPMGLMNAPGVVVNVPVNPGPPAMGPNSGLMLTGANDRPVVLRNLTIRNWTDGVRVVSGNVLLDNVRIEHNVQNGVVAMGTSQVAIVNSSIAASGFRLNPMGDFPRGVAPTSGIGVRFMGNSTGDIQRSSLTGNFGSGLSIETPRVRDVTIRDVQIFGNNIANNSATNLINMCRQATGRNFDEAEVCFQAVQRIVLGIQEAGM
jgi:hypothetical protein